MSNKGSSGLSSCEEVIEVICPENEYLDGSDCKTCPPGYASNKGSEGSGSCEEVICDENHYLVGTKCNLCPAGFWSQGGRTQRCYPNCPKNQYRDGVLCKSCPGTRISPAGSVGVNASHSYCQKNYYDNGLGCVQCPWGHRSNPGAIGKNSCEKVICPANQYYWQEKNICKSCPPGKGHPPGAPQHMVCK